MSRQLDIGSHNPRMQCAACGRWMRLHGRDEDGSAIQRFYGGCEVTGGNDHPIDGDVCAMCCPTKCREALAARCQKIRDGEKYWKCDRCESLWADMLHDTDWRPSACPEHHTLSAADGGSKP